MEQRARSRAHGAERMEQSAKNGDTPPRHAMSAPPPLLAPALSCLRAARGSPTFFRTGAVSALTLMAAELAVKSMICPGKAEASRGGAEASTVRAEARPGRGCEEGRRGADAGAMFARPAETAAGVGGGPTWK